MESVTKSLKNFNLHGRGKTGDNQVQHQEPYGTIASDQFSSRPASDLHQGTPVYQEAKQAQHDFKPAPQSTSEVISDKDEYIPQQLPVLYGGNVMQPYNNDPNSLTSGAPQTHLNTFKSRVTRMPRRTKIMVATAIAMVLLIAIIVGSVVYGSNLSFTKKLTDIVGASIHRKITRVPRDHTLLATATAAALTETVGMIVIVDHISDATVAFVLIVQKVLRDCILADLSFAYEQPLQTTVLTIE